MTEERNVVTCDDCKKEIVIKVRTQKKPGGLTRHYFNCSNCKREYTAYVTDKHINEERKELAKINRELIKRKQNLSSYMARKKSEVDNNVKAYHKKMR